MLMETKSDILGLPIQVYNNFVEFFSIFIEIEKQPGKPIGTIEVQVPVTSTMHIPVYLQILFDGYQDIVFELHFYQKMDQNNKISYVWVKCNFLNNKFHN